jgi:hypothetical protein
MANLGGGKFMMLEADTFNPQYGGVNWKPRLNNMLEENNYTMQPVGYREGDSPIMQLTQDNAMLFINSFVDEMDALAIMYEHDPDGVATWYFRDKLEASAEGGFNRVVSVIGEWVTRTVTLYPMEHVVQTYENLYNREIPDCLPDGFK